MTFSRVKPSGWAFGEILTSAQMNSLDDNVSKAIDGDQGGEYEPANQLEINGAGVLLGALEVDGLTHTGTALFNGTYSFDTSSAVTGLDDTITAGADDSSTTYAALNRNATRVVTYDAITANRNYKISDMGAATGRRILFLTTNGASSKLCTVQDPTAGSLIVLNGAQYQWALVERFSSANDWRVVKTNVPTGQVPGGFVIGDANDHTYAALTTNRIRVPSGGIAAPRGYTIDDTGCRDGMDFIVANYNGGGHAITINKPGPTPLVSVQDGSWSWCIRRSGTWELFIDN